MRVFVVVCPCFERLALLGLGYVYQAGDRAGKYPNESRRTVLDLVKAGKPVAEIAEKLGVLERRFTALRISGASDLSVGFG